ncbi:Cytochrome c oxidase copper chaperone [Macrophomina phaseolina MS6]|uniref:Cytochrome c oxidase copper chaperone n=1 Tax=Macrophomina phaseolina (strain MS6) TaxID=1126212 RepID=K2S5R2_MACPH|nr:Cytochrome c oxidase copper chaperone [Macrophomina phaseolina MS6]
MASEDPESQSSNKCSLSLAGKEPEVDSTDRQALVPPNGGVRAWACVAGSFLLQFCSFGYVNACGVFQYYYQDSLLADQSSSSLAWITTLQVFLLFMFGPFVGKLIDAHGCRKILGPFSLLAVLSVCMLSLCKTYWQVMLAQGVAFGFAASGLSLPAMTLATQWFSTKRGLAVGVVSCGSSLGGVVFPLIIPRLVSEVGFAAAVRWVALLQGILLAAANVLCSTPFPPKGRQRKGEESGSRKVGLKAFLSWPWLFFVLGCFFTMWGLFAPLNYLPEMAAAKGMDERLAQYTLAIANAGSVIGRVLPGWMSDHVGTFNVMTAVSSLSGVLVLAFWLPLQRADNPADAGIIVFALLYGFCSGGFVSLGAPCVAVGFFNSSSKSDTSNQLLLSGLK